MKVLKIGAIWCNSCNVMRPRWQQIEEENPWLETEYFEYDDNPKLIDKFSITSEKLPVFIFLDNNSKVLHELSGEPSMSEIVELIKKYKDK